MVGGENLAIVVTIDGSGHNFPATARRSPTGDRPFIIVTPCVVSNGRDPADLAAVLEIVKEMGMAKGQPEFYHRLFRRRPSGVAIGLQAS